MFSSSMRRALAGLACFMALTAAVVLGLLAVNARGPALPADTALPVDLAVRSYTLSGLVYDEAAGGYAIHLRGAPSPQVYALTMYERPAAFWRGDRLLADFPGAGSSARNAQVLFTLDASGVAELLIRASASEAGHYTPWTLFASYNAQSPKLVLSTAENARRSLRAANALYYILIGLYGMLIAASLTMARRKRSEKYLISLSVASFFVLLYLLSASEDQPLAQLFPWPEQLRTVTYILPVSALAYTCVSLFPEDIPPRLRPLYRLPAFAALTALALLVGLLSPVNTYQPMRRAMLLLCLPVAARAWGSGRKGAAAVWIAYALMEGITLFLYINNSVLDRPYAPFFMFVRVKEIGNLILVLTCAAVIFDRFAGKYAEAERLSREVSELNASLEAKVEERTRQLRQAQEQRRAMMINIFHDLRSPLFVLQGRVEQLRPHGPEEEEGLRVIRGRLLYLRRLTEDLFLLAKLESGELTYDQDYVRLLSVCRAVVDSLSAMAAEKRVRLILANACGEAVTWGDGLRIQQAVTNLAENAITHTPAGGTVSITVDRAGECCRVSVADTGEGIPPEAQTHIFDRYYRGDRRDPRSSGLGLPIAREITENHRGTLTVRSAPGEGSVFTMELPGCDTTAGGA